MTHTCRYSQTLGRISVLFALALLTAKPGIAQQQEFQIMVSGPWSYVSDPGISDRIFLVAPFSLNSHHRVYILPGPNAAGFSGSGISKGTHTLDFTVPQATYNAVPLDAPIVCTASVDPAKVNTILSNTSTGNYVISLPKPSDYSTYIDPAAVVDGYSESKVSTVDPAVNPSVRPGIYTTWMVLHYEVQSPMSALNWTGPGSSPTIPTVDSAGRGGAISIVLGDPNLGDDDFVCDSISLESFRERNSLWGLTEYVRFPRQNLGGHQIHYLYDYSCADSVSIMARGAKRTESKSGGGADCHACQMSINTAGPQQVPTP